MPTTKADVAADILALVSADDRVTSAGGTVTRTVSDRVDETLELGLSGTKQTLPQQIVEAAGLAWDADCWSRGGTVTLEGLQRLLAATQRLLADRESRAAQERRMALKLAAEKTAPYHRGSDPSDLDLCTAITRVVAGAMPRHLDGRDAVRDLRAWGNQWRQTEWIGWWVEHTAREALVRELGGTVGPRFHHTTFDYQLGRVFDVKSHVHQAEPVAILNDATAIEAAVAQSGAIGFIVVSGDATYDDDRAFQRWHLALQGRTLDVRPNSRRRKAAFAPTHVRTVLLRGIEAVRSALATGLLMYMQQGRQASGALRPLKYRLHLTMPVPADVLDVRIDLDPKT